MELDFEFERQAMKNEPMPKGLDYVDATIYQGFAWLYQRYYSGKISRDFAKKEKEIPLLRDIKQDIETGK